MRKPHAKALTRWRWIFRNEYIQGSTYESRHSPMPIRDPHNGRRRSPKGAVFRYAIVMAAAILDATYDERIRRARENRFSDAKLARISRLAIRKIDRDEAKDQAGGRTHG